MPVDAGTDAGFDAGRDAARDAGHDAGIDGGPWLRLGASLSEASWCHFEQAQRPEESYERLDDWAECGPGCRELDLRSLGATNSDGAGPAWFDPESSETYINIGSTDFRFVNQRVVRLGDGATHLALRKYTTSGARDRFCYLAYVRVDIGRWAATAFVQTEPITWFVWQGELATPTRPSAVATWPQAVFEGPDRMAIAPAWVAGREGSGRAVLRLDTRLDTWVDARFQVLPSIGIVGSGVLFEVYDFSDGVVSFRWWDADPRTTSTNLLLSDTDVGAVLGEFATDGSVVVFDTLPPEGIEPPTNLYWAPVTPTQIGARRLLATDWHGALRAVKYGWAATERDSEVELFRLADGHRWILPTGAGLTVGRVTHIAPHEVGVSLYERDPATGGRRIAALRLVRFDSLGPPTSTGP